MPKFCGFCNNTLIRKTTEPNKDWKNRRFCNRSCASKFHNSNTAKPIKPEHKTSTCVSCGTTIFRQLLKNQTHYSTKKYCEDCRPVEAALNLSKTNSKLANRTKEELFSSRKNWQSARTGIRNHAHIILQASKQKPECKVCNYTTHVEVCHIKPVSEFSGDSLIKDINHLSNLMYLCPNHHWEFDNGRLKL
jgi:5-methylcytosine-specific restriction endonuclease McrA